MGCAKGKQGPLAVLLIRVSYVFDMSRSFVVLLMWQEGWVVMGCAMGKQGPLVVL